MLTAYLDVSRGSEPVYVLGGYIGRASAWDKFGDQWRRMLADEQISVFTPEDLDLKDKVTGERIGKFKGWSDDRALAFQRRAHEIIKRHRRVSVASGIALNDFNIKFGWFRKEDGLPRLYYHSALSVLGNVADWIARYKVKDPIQYVFETGDEGYYEVERALQQAYKDPADRARLNMRGYSRAEKKCVLQLQAAGIWAYECYKLMANRIIDGPKLPVRDAYRSLYRKYDEPYNSYWDKENLSMLMEEYKALGGEFGKAG
jgi:hypothetical protein